MSVLRIAGNVIWLIFVGWWSALVHFLLGGLFCITIIGIPIGKACFQFAKMMLWPFGKTIVRETDIKGKENVATVRRVGGVIANILWLPIGISLFIGYVSVAIGCFITIIGIPFGLMWLKLSVLVVWPLGAKVVTIDEGKAIQAAKQERLNRQYMQKVTGETVQPVPTQNGENSVQVENDIQGVSTSQGGTTYSKESIAQGVSAVQSSVAAGAATAGAALKETGAKASAAAKQYTEQTGSYIKSVYSKNSEAAQSRDMQMSWNSIMEQTEAALFRNKYAAAVLSFLPYILGTFVILFVILGLLTTRSFSGIFYGLAEGSVVFVLLGVLFTIRRQYAFSAACFLGTAGIMFLSVILNAIVYSVLGSYFVVLSVITTLLKIVVCALFGAVSLFIKAG